LWVAAGGAIIGGRSLLKVMPMTWLTGARRGHAGARGSQYRNCLVLSIAAAETGVAYDRD
jgi:hypothetical protein